MPHDSTLVATIVIGLSLAFVLGAIGQRLRISPLVGYLLAGVVIGPHTPGFVADQSLADQLAEIGVILLMFGVGLHFSLKDLLSVSSIAIPGALVQIVAATLMGLGLASFLEWPLAAGSVFGLALSVASTVVTLRALQERRLVSSIGGRVAVGWLVVEDMVMVLALVALPAVIPFLGGGPLTSGAVGSSFGGVLTTLALTIGKVAAFIALMLIVGRRMIPWILHYIAHTGSRELFRLGVLSIALGIAFGAAKLFDVSFALGAFLAGMILSESELSQRAGEETLPLRDAFSVLFFVSVGMLFDPAILARDFGALMATVSIIVLGKSLAALAILLAFGYSLGTAVTISVSRAQIGEFSFILAGLGVALGVLPERGRDLVLAGALLSILINPLLFLALARLGPSPEKRESEASSPSSSPPVQSLAPTATDQEGHVVLVGYGKVGRRVGEALERDGLSLFVIDERDEVVEKLKARGVNGVVGSGLAMLPAANLPKAKSLLVAIPDSFEAGQIVAQARAARSDLLIVARGHSDAELEYLEACGASAVVFGAEKIADAMVSEYSARARDG